MKRLTLILLVTAFALTPACTDSEKVLPYEPTQEIEFDQETEPGNLDQLPPSNIKPSNVQVEKGPNLAPTLTFPTPAGEDPTKSGEEVTEAFGELLPASFMDCGTFIRKNDGTLLNIVNMKVPQFYTKTGSKVRFGYVANPDLRSTNTCDIGLIAYVTYIEFLQTEVNEKSQSAADQSHTK